MYILVREPLDAQKIVQSLCRPEDGAVVIFEGVVRNRSRDKEVLFLEYEAYESMALKQMEEIGRETLARWPIRHLAMVHRLGQLQIGECSVVIVVVSAHRGEAFEACRFAVDALKEKVPIWKKEHYTDGETWIEG